jgi:hypothetical protein
MMKYQKVAMWKRYDPNANYGAGDFVNQIFLVTLEFDEAQFLEFHPHVCSRGKDLEAHQFVKQPTGVFMKCLVQGTTEGIKPDIEQGKPFEWVHIVEAKPISDNEARRLCFGLRKFVATPDIILHLMKGGKNVR